MRMMQWLGGMWLVGLALFGGCSCEEELPSLPDLLGRAGAGGTDGEDEIDGTGGARPGAGGASGGRIGTGGAAGNAAGSSGREAAGNEAGASGATGGSAGAAGENVTAGNAGSSTGFAGRSDPGNLPDGGQVVSRDAGRDGSQPDTPRVPDSGQVPDVIQVTPDVVTTPDPVTPDPIDTSCKITSGGRCELSVQFVTQSGEIAGLTLITCPDGADPTTGVCMGYGDLSNPQWSASNDGRSLVGTVGVRAPDIVATVQKTVLGFPISMTCHLAIGGADYLPLPIEVALPDGVSASDFIPGCTAVSNPQITLRGPVEFTVSGDSGCPSAAALAQESGGLSTLEQGVQTLIASALTSQICKAR